MFESSPLETAEGFPSPAQRMCVHALRSWTGQKTEHVCMWYALVSMDPTCWQLTTLKRTSERGESEAETADVAEQALT